MMFKIDTRKLEEVAAAYPASGMKVFAVLVQLKHDLRADPRGTSLPEDLGEALEVLLTSHKAMAEAGEEMPTLEELAKWADSAIGSGPDESGEIAAAILTKFRPTIARLRRERDEKGAEVAAAHILLDGYKVDREQLFMHSGKRRPWTLTDRIALLHDALDDGTDTRRLETNTVSAKTTYTVNVDTSEAQTKLEMLLASAREYEAALDRALTKTNELRRVAVLEAEIVRVAEETREVARVSLEERRGLIGEALGCSDPADIGITKPPPPPPPPSVVDFGQRARAARRDKRLTLEDVSNALGMSIPRVSDIERNDGRPVSHAEKKALCQFLGLSEEP